MRPVQLLQLAFIPVAALAVFGFVRMAEESESRRACTPLCALRPAYAGDDRLAPDFELDDLDGRKVRLSSYRGKTVILSFWTRTCGPCLEEMPTIAELAKVLAGRTDVALLTVSTDERDDAKAALRSVLRGEAGFPVLLDPEADVVRGKYGTRLFPETWIIDPAGVIRARFDGARDWSSAMVLDLVHSVAHPNHCAAAIQAGAPAPGAPRVCDTEG